MKTASLLRPSPGPCPPGIDPRRWRKMHENMKRAERLTGIVPMSPEGWETVAVILMDSIEGGARER